MPLWRRVISALLLNQPSGFGILLPLLFGLLCLEDLCTMLVG
jgi:hypothetical protein